MNRVGDGIPRGPDLTVHLSHLLLVPSLIFGLMNSKANGENRPSHSLPTLSAVVNGRTGSFLIDTGTEHSMVDRAFSKELGLPSTGVVEVQQNYSSEELNAVTAEHFHVGDREYSNVSLLEFDLTSMSAAQGVRFVGILGTDFLESMYVVLSYSSGSARAVANLDGAGDPLRLRKSRNVFFVPVLIGQSVIELLLDSGTNSTAIAAVTWQALSILRKPNWIVEGIRSAGSSVTSDLSCAPQFRFGRMTLSNQVVRVIPPTRAGSFANGSFSGLLGTDILEHFEVTLDLAHSIIYLLPNLAYRLDPNSFVTIGIQFFKTDTNNVEVAAVWKHSPAEEAGILVGDQIVSVNGNRSEELTLQEFTNQIHQAPGSPITLEIKRSGRDLLVRTATGRLACED
jgi:PDZ domain/Aspartyl protease